MKHKIVTGKLLDEDCELTLEELSRACMVQSEWIVELVEEGILEPAGEDAADWRFSGTSLKRARTTMRLQQDLDINLAGAALVLDLLEEIDSLRARLQVINQEH